MRFTSVKTAAFDYLKRRVGHGCQDLFFCVALISLRQDFEEGCSGLLRCGALSIDDHGLRAMDEEQDTAVFLGAVLEPFIETYQVIRDSVDVHRIVGLAGKLNSMWI